MRGIAWRGGQAFVGNDLYVGYFDGVVFAFMVTWLVLHLSCVAVSFCVAGNFASATVTCNVVKRGRLV